MIYRSAKVTMESDQAITGKLTIKGPLVICYIAIESGDLWWIYSFNMVSFHSYVKLSEGNMIQCYLSIVL